MKTCSSWLVQIASAENVCWLLDLIRIYSTEPDTFRELGTLCVNIIEKEWENVLHSSSFEGVDRIIISSVIQIVIDEADPRLILDGCLRWAKKKCKEKLIEPSPGNLREELDDCFDSIR